MFISALLIDVGDNPDRPRPGRLWLRNMYHVHQRLCMAFPSDPRKTGDPEFLQPFRPEDFEQQVGIDRAKEAGFLFRIDSNPGGRVVVLVQSAIAPDWEYAFQNADYLLAAPVECKEFNPFFAKDTKYKFRLRANPTVKKKVEGKKNGSRQGVFTEEKQKEWLESKGESAGFLVGEVCVINEGIIKVWGKGDQRLSFLSVLYEGWLEVKEPESFVKTVHQGIGSAKGFGFGLLSLARV